MACRIHQDATGVGLRADFRLKRGARTEVHRRGHAALDRQIGIDVCVATSVTVVVCAETVAAGMGEGNRRVGNVILSRYEPVSQT
jgi:hypothetical protein